MVLISERVEMLLLVIGHIPDALIYGGAPVSHFLQDCLQHNHIPDSRVLQNVNLKNKSKELIFPMFTQKLLLSSLKSCYSSSIH